MIERGEEPLDAAKRELLEETGYSGGKWTNIMTIMPNPGLMTNRCHCFLATGVERVSGQHLDESEDIEVIPTPRSEVLAMLQADKFHQALMAAPLWKYFATRK